MAKDDIYETIIIIDHETGEVRIDTTREGVWKKLPKLGFIEVTVQINRPYHRFLGAEKQISFRRATKVARVVRGEKRSSILGSSTPRRKAVGEKK